MKTKVNVNLIAVGWPLFGITLKPTKGSKKLFFGKQFVYSGSAWCLDEITHNVINKKNAGLKGYPIHSYSM